MADDIDDIIPLRASYVLSMFERISELEAEIGRLRSAGDALHDSLAWWGKGNDAGDAARAAWQEARRG